jgi:hypothetical protein
MMIRRTSIIGRVIGIAIIFAHYPSHPLRAIRCYRRAMELCQRMEQWAEDHPGMVGQVDLVTREIEQGSDEVPA